MLLQASVTLLFIVIASAEKENCTDVEDRFVEHGLLYVPGPNLCTQCVCHHSEPKWCQTMFCNGPPIMCKNYTVGRTCCQFECHDPPTEKPPPSVKELRNAANYPVLSFISFIFTTFSSILSL